MNPFYDYISDSLRNRLEKFKETEPDIVFMD